MGNPCACIAVCAVLCRGTYRPACKARFFRGRRTTPRRATVPRKKARTATPARARVLYRRKKAQKQTQLFRPQANQLQIKNVRKRKFAFSDVTVLSFLHGHELVFLVVKFLQIAVALPQAFEMIEKPCFVVKNMHDNVAVIDNCPTPVAYPFRAGRRKP